MYKLHMLSRAGRTLPEAVNKTESKVLEWLAENEDKEIVSICPTCIKEEHEYIYIMAITYKV